MKDSDKSKELLVEELQDLRARLAQSTHPPDTDPPAANHYHLLMEQSPDWITTTDNQGKFLDVNAAGCQLTGYSRQELLSLSLADLMPPEDLQKQPFRFDELSTGRTVRINRRIRRKDGTFFLAEVNARMLPDGTMQGIARDITQQVHDQEALKHSEERYRSTIDAMDDLVHVVDADLRIVLANRALVEWCKQHGRDTQWQGRQPFEIFEFLDENIRQEYRQVFEKAQVVTGEYTFEVDGQLCVAETRKIPVIESGRVVRVVTVIRDITERQDARKQLQHAQEDMERLIRNIPDGVYSALPDETATAVFASEHFERWAGQRTDHAGATVCTWFDCIHPDDRQNVFDTFHQACRNKTSCTTEYRVIHRQTCRVVHLRDRAIPVLDDAGNVLRFDGIVTDITERKLAQNALKHSEEQYRSTIDAMDDLVHVVDADLRIVLANRALVNWCKQYGRDPNWQGKHPFDIFEFLGEEVRQEYRQVFEQAQVLTTEETTEIDGRLFVTETRKIPVIQSGRVVRVVTVIRNITQRKQNEQELTQHRTHLEHLVRQRTADLAAANQHLQAEVAQRHQADQALQAERRLLRTIVDNLPDSIYVKDTEGRFLFANTPCARRVHAASVDELVGKTDAHFAAFTPEQARALRQDEEHIVHTGIPMIGREQPISNDIDGRSWISITKMPWYGPDGRIAGIVGLNRDISELKRAADALRQSEEKYRTVVENADAAIFTIDRQGLYHFVNGVGARQLGHTPETVVGRTVWDLFPREHADKHMQAIHQVIDSGCGLERETVTVIQGRQRHYSMNIQPLFDAGGAIEYALGIGLDVTERKLAEQAVREKEHQYRTLVDTMSEGLAIQDADNILTYVNQSLCEITGYDRQELIGRSSRFLIAPESLPDYHEQNILRRQGLPVRYELKLSRKDGSNVTVIASIRPLFDDHNDYTGCFIVLTDISTQKHTQELLSRSEQRFRELVEFLPEAIFEVDLEGYVTLVNHRAFDLTGYGPADFDNPMKTLDLLAPKDRPQGQRAIQRLLSAPAVEAREYTLLHKNGAEVPIFVRATSVLQNGDIVGVRGVAVDLREQKQTQAQLNTFRERMTLAERLNQLGMVGATMAHRLGQPLTVMRLLLQDCLLQLQDTSSCPTVAAYIVDSLTELGSAIQVIEQFRTVARRPTSGRREPFDLAPLAQQVIRALDDAAQRAQLQLVTQDLDQLPPVVGDPNEIEQVFFILIQNAIQAVNKSRKCTLQITGRRLNGHVLLHFADDCGGIDPQHLERLFEPFFTTKPQGEGTGLGLPIVQHIVENHRGKVTVENRPGQGVTFCLTLPLAQPG